jgi:tyrosinase
MAEKAKLRIRRSIQEMQKEYDDPNGNKKPLEDLMRAWKGIKELPPENFNSFFVIAGYHGEPFRGAGWGNSSYWGGYCNHGNILFPTWHRVYCLRVENALRSVDGCQEVTLPFWDEASADSVQNGIPRALTDEFFTLDGKPIPNPLKSFVLTHKIVDHLSPFPDADYSKPKNYETVRYPLSGLVGPGDIEATKKHNAQFPNYQKNVGLLNTNIKEWLGSQIIVNGQPIPTNTRRKYERCLDAPNYTVFSNTTSASQWFDDTGSAVVPIESPHNDMHLAVGGYDIPKQFDVDELPGANGDMGENDTAAFDPIFFFHHCFIDRVFWLWQKKHGLTENLEIIDKYPGTNSVDNQGPTPGVVPNSWLTLDSPLDPFKKTEGGKERTYTSRDCINIETQLGYTYGPGSLDALLQPQAAMAAAAAEPSRIISVRGINRAGIRGSFLISAFAEMDGKLQHVGTESVLSRWHVEGCANCQTHLEARAAIPLRGAQLASLDKPKVQVEVRTRHGRVGEAGAPIAAAAAAAPARPAFRFDII